MEDSKNLELLKKHVTNKKGLNYVSPSKVDLESKTVEYPFPNNQNFLGFIYYLKEELKKKV